MPEVLWASDGLLVLEHVAGDTLGPDSSPAVARDLGRRLADLHGVTAERDGFPFDTLSGAYRQPNPRTDDWPTFFGECRLRHVSDAARDEGTLSSAVHDWVTDLVADLDRLVPPEPPASLCHGDLWQENVVVAPEGDRIAAVLDPACSYGHAEVDLAYCDYVGLGEAFFAGYRERRAIPPGFRERRRDVYALYPLLEHVRVFDEDRYRAGVADVLDRLGY
ncbi:MAG: fructosamine kinase family protein [Halolamina sp.]